MEFLPLFPIIFHHSFSENIKESSETIKERDYQGKYWYYLFGISWDRLHTS